MRSPTTTDINRALESIAATERPADHARTIARERITQFRLDREKGEKPLPTVNIVDSGAPLLDRDEVLRASYPNCVGKK